MECLSFLLKLNVEVWVFYCEEKSKVLKSAAQGGRLATKEQKEKSKTLWVVLAGTYAKIPFPAGNHTNWLRSCKNLQKKSWQNVILWDEGDHIEGEEEDDALVSGSFPLTGGVESD